MLAVPDRDTAQWSADCLGRSEVEGMNEGLSYGANTIRDGVSLTPKRELRALALASEIMRLQNLNGYLRFPGPLPVARIRLDYSNRPKIAERFVPSIRQEVGGRNPVKLEPAPKTDEIPADDIPVATEAQKKSSGCLPAPKPIDETTDRPAPKATGKTGKTGKTGSGSQKKNLDWMAW